MPRLTTAVQGLCPKAAFQPTAYVRSATQTHFIAGPLALMRWLPAHYDSFYLILLFIIFVQIFLTC